MLKKVSFGILASSLIFAQAAFADQDTSNTNVTTTTTTINTTGSSDVTTNNQPYMDSKHANQFSKKLDKIENKLDQFKNQQVPAQALLGKYGSIENRISALQKQLDQLQGTAAQEVVNNLSDLYNQSGDVNSAFRVQKQFVQKKLDKKAKDEDILKAYKQLGQLLHKMGKTGIHTLVNGEEPNMDVPPTIENGRTLLPFRALAESLGAQVSYDPAARTVTVTKGTTKVVLTIDSIQATVDGKECTLDVPAKVVQGRTLIPLRFLGQALHSKVLWDQENQMAIVIGGDQSTNGATEVVPGTTTTNTNTTTTTEVVPTTDTTVNDTIEVTPTDSGTTSTTDTTTQIDTTTQTDTTTQVGTSTQVDNTSSDTTTQVGTVAQ